MTALAADGAHDLPSESAFKKDMRLLTSEIKKFKKLAKQEEGLLIPAQAAAMIGISPQAMERKIKDGQIDSFVILGSVWLSGKQIESMLIERVKKLTADGQSKNKIEEGIYRKMYLNAQHIRDKNKKRKG